MNTEQIIDNLQTKGYSVVENYFSINDKQVTLADSLLKDNKFERGAAYRTSNIGEFPDELFKLVCNKDIQSVFSRFAKDIRCQEIFVTHEYNTNILTRPNQLHFDRLRSLKVMIYITDVSENNGPLSIVPGSHKKSCLLRRQFVNMSYENKGNIVEKHYPHLYEEPIKICGDKGTLIFFDSDVFHLGGKNEENHERKIIRSHWYPSPQWRHNS